MRFLGWLFLLAATLPAAALSSTRVEPGARVRVWVEGRPTIGTLDRIESSRLHLQGNGERSWDLDEVERVEVSTGRQGHALAGALIGLVTGFAIAAVTVAAVDGGGGGLAPSNSEIEKTVFVGLGVWSGSVVTGALIGHSVKTDRWASRSIRPASGTSRVGLRFRF